MPNWPCEVGFSELFFSVLRFLRIFAAVFCGFRSGCHRRGGFGPGLPSLQEPRWSFASWPAGFHCDAFCLSHFLLRPVGEQLLSASFEPIHTAPQRAASAKWRACSSDSGAIRKDRHQRGSKPRRELQQHRSPRAAQGATTLFIRCQGACSTIKGYNKRNSKMQVLWAPFHRRLTLLTFYFLPFWVQMHLQTNADPPKTRIRPNPPSPIRFARMLPNLLGLSAVGRSSVAYTLQRF